MNKEAVIAQYGTEVENYVSMIIEETMGTYGLARYEDGDIGYEIIEDIVKDYFEQ